MILNEWLEIWLNKYVKHTVKLRTYIVYQNIIKLHIEPSLGKIDLLEIDSNILQSFLNNKIEHGNLKNEKALSINTILMIKSILKQSLDFAFKLGLINNKYFTFILLPKRKEKEVDAFELEEQKILENYCLKSKKNNHFGIVLCLYTGIRIGELLALTWDDIDFDKKLLFVRHTLTLIKEDGLYKNILQNPKTINSKRIIPLPTRIIAYLKKIKRKSTSKYIISTRTNGVVSIRSYQRTFAKILNKCHIGYKNFHSLRHTFATRALELGMDVKTLSEILGHKSASITLNRYSHSMMKHKVLMMNKLGKTLE